MPDIRLALSLDEKGAIKSIQQTSVELDKLDKAATKTAATLRDKLGKGAGREVESAMRGMAGSAGPVGSVLAGLGPAGLAGAAGLAAVTAAVSLSGKALVAAALEAAIYGGKLADLSAKTGIGTEALQRLTQAGRLTGNTLEAMTAGVSKMQRALVETPQAFNAVGLSAAKLIQMQPDQAFARLSAEIARIENPAERAAAAMEIFGKGGAELLPVLTSDLAAAAAQAERLGMVLSGETVAALDEFGDSADTLKATWEGLWIQIGAAIATSPSVQQGIKDITEAIGALSVTIGQLRESGVLDFVVGRLLTLGRVAAGIGTLGFSEVLLQGGKLKSQSDFLNYRTKGPGFPEDAADAIPDPFTRTGMERLMGGAEAYAIAMAKAVAANKAYEDSVRRAAEASKKAAADALKNAPWFYGGRVDVTAAGPGAIPSLPQPPLATGISDESLRKQFEQNWDVFFGGATKATAATFDATRALQGFSDVVQILGGSSSGAARALGLVLGALSAIQGLPRVFGKGGVGLGGLDKNQKMQLGMGALQAGIGAYQGGSVLGGAAGGAAFGMQVGGPWGAAIGAVAGGALGFFGKAAKERKELEALRTELTATYGSMDKIRSLGAAVGVSMDAAFSTKSPKAAKAAIDAFEKALAKTKGELADWERGIVSAQARAFALTDDKDAQAFVRGQREAGVGGLGAAVKGIKLVGPEDARAQAAIASVVFWDTFKTEGLLKAAEAFKPIMESLQASLAKIGGDEAAAAILGPIQQLVDLGTTNESFRGATEGAQGLATTLDSLANRSIPLTAAQFGAFGQQASSAFEQAQTAAIEGGMGAAEAQSAAIMATAPLLQSLVQASQAYGLELDADTQRLLGMAEASGIAFKTDSTDRLIQSINALTSAMGGIPPTFDAIGESGTRAGTRTSVSLDSIPPAAETASAAVLDFGSVTTATLRTVALVTGDVASDMTKSWDVGTGIMAARTEILGDEMVEVFVETADFANTVFGYMTDDLEGALGQWKSISEIAVGDVKTAINELPGSVDIPIRFSGPVPGAFGFNYDGSPDNDGDKSNSFAAGVSNAYFGPRPGGHYIQVAEGGRGEYVTVTQSPVPSLATVRQARTAGGADLGPLLAELQALNRRLDNLPRAFRDAVLLRP